MGKPATGQKAEQRVGQWGRATRWLVSGWLCVHLVAVIVPPFSFQTSPIRGMGSPLAEAVMDLFQPYIGALYLNHGYAFFAPDPGPSHLLRAELTFADGRPKRTITMPDIERHWPRLLYHRYFMLSEHLNAAFAPAEPPPEMEPAQLPNWQFVRRQYERRKAAIEDYLRRRYGADSVTLVRVEHRLLDPYEMHELEMRPDAEETFIVLPETWEEGGAPR